MRVALGSDDKTAFTDALVDELQRRGHEVQMSGPLAGRTQAWPDVGRAVAMAVASGQAQLGIVCCYTGTGVSIAANKVRGVRAALCHDAVTAAGARQWNDANVLALSLRTTTIDVAREILDAWFAASCPAQERACVERLNAMDAMGAIDAIDAINATS